MSRNRFHVPKTVRLPLSDGDWIDVREDLSAGDSVDMYRNMEDRKKFSRPIAYLLAWSFVGFDGQPVPYDMDAPEDVRRDLIGNLQKRTIRELIAALDRHEAAVEAAFEAKKKTPDDAPASSATSLLLAAAIGGSSGFGS